MRAFDDPLEAIQASITMSGKPRKEVAQQIWSNLKPESAVAKLAAKLSPNGSEHFQVGEILAIMLYTGRFDFLYWLCDATGHKRPERRDDADEQARLTSAVQNATAILARALDQLDSLQAIGRTPSPSGR